MGNSLAVKYISYFFYALFAISIVFAITFSINMNEDILLYWTYGLVIAAAGVTFGFALINMFKDKKSALTSLAIIVFFGVLVGISYAFASDVIPTNAAGELVDVTASVSRWSGASLYMLYILLGLSFASLIYTEIKGALK